MLLYFSKVKDAIFYSIKYVNNFILLSIYECEPFLLTELKSFFRNKTIETKERKG